MAVTLNSRFSMTSADLDRTFGEQRIPSTQTTIFSEQAFTGDANGHQWALGVAFQHDALRVTAVPGVGYTYNVPGVFAQDEFSPVDTVYLTGGLRSDDFDTFGRATTGRATAAWLVAQRSLKLRASYGTAPVWSRLSRKSSTSWNI